jgi:hypothetical protein
MKPKVPYVDFDFEDLWLLAGELRFGSSMLTNRIMQEFNAFIQEGIFHTNSSENNMMERYNTWTNGTYDDINEYERLRRWLVLMIMHNYPRVEL